METDERTEAQRLIDKFGSHATEVAKEFRLLDRSYNRYFWELVIRKIDKINTQ